jgi:anti-sigma regulatory factor (Ser/Thr protein kinase)
MQPLLSVPLTADPVSSTLAREHASKFARPWVREEIVHDLAVLVTEVVANAVRHAGSDIRLDMTIRPGWLRVEVYDGSSELPVIRHPELTSDGGRGLQLVEAIAARWGARRQIIGKVVWFELRYPMAEAQGDA